MARPCEGSSNALLYFGTSDERWIKYSSSSYCSPSWYGVYLGLGYFTNRRALKTDCLYSPRGSWTFVLDPCSADSIDQHCCDEWALRRGGPGRSARKRSDVALSRANVFAVALSHWILVYVNDLHTLHRAFCASQSTRASCACWYCTRGHQPFSTIDMAKRSRASASRAF